MPAVKIARFGGIIPRLSSKLLPDSAAQIANNCRIKSGRLEPILQPAIDPRIGGQVTAACKTIQLWRHGAGIENEQWLSWNDHVSVAQSPIADDDKFRQWIAGKTGVSSGGVNNVPTVIGWSGMPAAQVTRAAKKTAMGILVPAATWKFNPMGAGNITISYVFHGTLVLTNAFGRSISYDFNSGAQAGTVTSATRLADGGLLLVLTVPDYTASYSQYQCYRSSALYSYQDYTITVTGNTIAGNVTTIAGQRANVTVSGAVIGQVAVVSAVEANGPNPVTLTIAGHDAGSAFPDQAYNTYSIKFTGGPSQFKCQECYSDIGNGQWGYSPGAGVYTNYIQTWVDDWGQESPPSVNSGELLVLPGQNVTLAAVASGGQMAGASSRRIYRVVTGTEGQDWQFVAEVTGAALWTAFNDTVKDEDCGEVMPTIENPPDDLDGLVALPGGFLAGFRGREVCFSEPWLPYSWPTAYRLTVDADIVGLACSGNDVYVLTKAFPYVITGSYPDVMAMTKLAFPQPCLSRTSIVASMGWVFYASPDGICGIQPGSGAKVMTEDFYTRVEWQRLNPPAMMIASHDSALHIFSLNAEGNTFSVIIDFPDGEKAITTTDEYALAAYSDVETDTLFYVRGDFPLTYGDAQGSPEDFYVYAWQGGGDSKIMTWRSKRFQDKRPVQFSCVKVTSDAYPATVALVDADGNLVNPVPPQPQQLIVNVYAGEAPASSFTPAAASMPILSQKAYRLPRWRQERVFEVEIVHQSPVDDLVVATNMEECR